MVAAMPRVDRPVVSPVTEAGEDSSKRKVWVGVAFSHYFREDECYFGQELKPDRSYKRREQLAGRR